MARIQWTDEMIVKRLRVIAGKAGILCRAVYPSKGGGVGKKIMMNLVEGESANNF